MNMLSDGAAKLASQLKDYAGTAATYKRGGLSVSLTGTRKTRMHEVIDSRGFMVQVQSIEWIFTAADLVLSGQVIEPRPGDLVVSGGQEFEVIPLGAEPCFEPNDTGSVMLTVHTKRIC